MQAGRELDALVAEKVMGWKKIYRKAHSSAVGDWHGLEWMWDKREGALWQEAQSCPHYSTDIAAAFTITKKTCNTWAMFWHDAYAQWQVKCDHQRRTAEDCRYEGRGHELSLAICLAALKAVGHDKA